MSNILTFLKVSGFVLICLNRFCCPLVEVLWYCPWGCDPRVPNQWTVDIFPKLIEPPKKKLFHIFAIKTLFQLLSSKLLKKFYFRRILKKSNLPFLSTFISALPFDLSNHSLFLKIMSSFYLPSNLVVSGKSVAKNIKNYFIRNQTYNWNTF